MDKNIQESIINYLDNSPKKAVKFILRDKKAEYGANIKKHRDIKSISGDEELVRGYLIAKLVNELGYKEKNIEIEKEYDIGRPKVNKPRIDVIVRDENSGAFLYIELKSPQDYEKDKDEIIEKQLFNLASQEQGQGKNVKYLVLYTVELAGKGIKDKKAFFSFKEKGIIK